METEGETFRSSHWRCSVRKDVLRNFTKLTGKHLCQGLFFNKVVGLMFSPMCHKPNWWLMLGFSFFKYALTCRCRSVVKELIVTVLGSSEVSNDFRPASSSFTEFPALAT